MSQWRRQRGFTMTEIMVALAVVGILSAIAIVVYRQYADRARSVDILVQYDAARTRMGAALAQGSVSKCADLAEQMGGAAMNSLYARLSIGMVAVHGEPASGWRPVMEICARADRHGSQGMEAAREAFNILSRDRRVEGGAIVNESMVRFSVPLSEGTGAQCAVPVAYALDPCGDPVAAPAPDAVTTPTPTATPSAAAPPSPTPSPAAAPSSAPTPAATPSTAPTPAPATPPMATPAPPPRLPVELAAPPGATRQSPTESAPPAPPRAQGTSSQVVVQPSQSSQPSARSETEPTCVGGQVPGPGDAGCVCPSGTQWQVDICVPVP